MLIKQLKSNCMNIWYRMAVCILFGMLAGSITHLYMLTNKLPNWDDITCYWSYGAGESIGRWFLPVLKNITGWMSVPAMNGVVTILCLSFAAFFIIESLSLCSPMAIILTTVMVVIYPSIISQMTFMFTSSCYGIAIVFSCMAAFLIRRDKTYTVIMGILLIILSLGVYQAYFCIVSGVLVLSLILDLAREEEIKRVWKTGLYSLISLVIAMVLYLGITRLIMPYQLDNYKGISSMGDINILQMPRLVGRAYKRIIEYFITNPFSYTSNLARVCNIMICLLIAIVFIYILWLYGKKKEWKRVFFLLVMGILFPLALSSIYIMTPEVSKQSTLTLLQYVLVYVMLIALIDEIHEKDRRIGIKAVSIVSLILIIVIGGCNYSLANNAYYRMHLSYQRAYAYYNRLLMNLENTGEYEYGEPILIIGNFWPKPTPLSSMNLEDERFTDLEGVAMENGLLTSGVRRNFIRVFLGYNMPEVSTEQENRIINSESYKNMGIYPQKHSIERIDNVWVIKVAEEKQEEKE